MMRLRTVVAMLVLLLASGTYVAADVAPLAIQMLIQVLSRRVDVLEQRVDRMAFGTGVFAYAHIDAVSENYPGTVAIVGWAFGCGFADSRVVMVVDDVEVGGTPARLDRSDVNAAYAGTCNVIGQTGVLGAVDMSLFEPGWNGDHVHAFKLRVYPPTWPTVTPFAVAESPVVTFTTW